MFAFAIWDRAEGTAWPGIRAVSSRCSAGATARTDSDPDQAILADPRVERRVSLRRCHLTFDYVRGRRQGIHGFRRVTG
jgi:hypothetical protein